MRAPMRERMMTERMMTQRMIRTMASVLVISIRFR